MGVLPDHRVLGYAQNLAPHTAAYIYNVAIQSVLSFGGANVNIKSRIKELEKTQGILIKAALNLAKRSKNNSLLRALNEKKK